MSDVMTVVMWAQLALSLICIAVGLKWYRPLAGFGAMGIVGAVFWLLRNIVAEPILIPLTFVAFTAAAVWWYFLIRRASKSRVVRGQPNPVFVLVFIADAAVAGLLLYVLGDPVPVLITFGAIYLGSFLFIRKLQHDQPAPSKP